MTIFKKIKFLIPFLILFPLFGVLYRELFYAHPQVHPSALIGEEVPHFKLPTLFSSSTFFSQKELSGKVVLLNVWASWCEACTKEHDMLMRIKNDYQIPIYGLLYKDETTHAKTWLNQVGNPYVLIGNDYSGDVAIDLGVYGTPETFVISPSGKIIYRHIGALDQSAWDNVIYPLILQYTSSTFDIKRFQALTKDIRCVVCQNQSIADSNAPLAHDLREKIYQMMMANQSNDEIKSYLVKRYGEFILLEPRLNKTTFLLWVFPFFGLILIVFFLSWIRKTT